VLLENLNADVGGQVLPRRSSVAHHTQGARPLRLYLGSLDAPWTPQRHIAAALRSVVPEPGKVATPPRGPRSAPADGHAHLVHAYSVSSWTLCCAPGRRRQSLHAPGQRRSRRRGTAGGRLKWRVRQADGSTGGGADRAGGWWLYDGSCAALGRESAFRPRSHALKGSFIRFFFFFPSRTVFFPR